MTVGKKLAVLATFAGAIAIVPSAPALADCQVQSATPAGARVDVCVATSGSSPAKPTGYASVSSGSTRVYAESNEQGRVTPLAGVCAGAEPSLPSTLDPTACVNYGYKSTPTAPWTRCTAYVSLLGTFACGAPVG